RAAHTCRTGTHAAGCCRRSLPALPSGSGDDYRTHPRGGRWILHFGLEAARRMDAALTGKVAIVTGGSRGIGRAIVELLAAEGADVTFFYREHAAAAAEVVGAGKTAG